MPRVFRIMRKDVTGFPHISPTSLGVRVGIDIDLDGQSNVLVNGKGMSVAPDWRDINVLRIPKRLRQIVPGANGSNNTFCFRIGTGEFARGVFADGLMLEPDSPKHGNITPAQIAPLSKYQSNIAATQSDWQEDEN